ncbi:MAG: type II secretion system inner membrane protein GspF [Persicimonas sp.]
MPVYEYKGLNAQGKKVQGIQNADSQAALRQLLQSQGVYVTDIWEEHDGAGARAGEVDVKKLIERVTLRDISVLTRQMATLMRAGIPLVEALKALGDQVEKDELKRVISDVRQKVNEGSSLAKALGDHPEHFTNLYVNMVRAGESSGNLDVVLDRLTDFLEAQIELRGKVIGAMVYPLIMVVVGVLIMGVLFVFVIPKVTQIFQDQDAALPWITRFLIGTSELFANWWFILIPGAIAAAWGFKKWKETPDGKDIWDRFVLKVPIFGPLIRMIAVARFARTLGTLLANGVPLLTALDIVKNILGNNRLIEVVEIARINIREGESIAKPLERSGEFPPLVTHMIAIGEKSGQLEEMLENVAAAYNQEVDMRVQALTTLLEPLLIVGMGVGVAVIVFAVMLPILQLNQTIL